MTSQADDVYLFRGTTRDWQGNLSAVEQSLTYTSLDPVVATLFAVECRSYGPAVVLASVREKYQEVGASVVDEAFQRIECSATLGIQPRQFAREAEFSVEVDTCLAILDQLGIHGLPTRINGKSSLQDTLVEAPRSTTDTPTNSSFPIDDLGRTAMRDRPMEFIVAEVLRGEDDLIPGPYCMVIGRCGDSPISKGEVFHASYRYRRRRYPEEMGDEAVRVEEHPVRLEVVEIQTHNRSFDTLGEGMTGALFVRGEGLDRLTPGWVIGQPVLEEKPEGTSYVTPEPAEVGD